MSTTALHEQLKPVHAQGGRAGHAHFDTPGVMNWGFPLDEKLLSSKPSDLMMLLLSYTQVSSIAAHDAAVATGAMPQILLWVSAFEAISTVAVIQMLEGSGRIPGDFGFDPNGLYSKPGMEKKRVRDSLARQRFAGAFLYTW